MLYLRFPRAKRASSILNRYLVERCTCVLLYNCAREQQKMIFFEEHRVRSNKRRVNMERCTVGTNKRNPYGLTVPRAFRPPEGRYSPEKWMNYLTNLLESTPIIDPLQSVGRDC